MDLVAVAISEEFDATHVNHLSRRGATDRSLAVSAFERDAVFVTNNARDFKRIYRQFDLHPGLMVILPSVRPDLQADLFVLAVARLRTLRDCVNLLVEVDIHGVVTVSDWSRDAQL